MIQRMLTPEFYLSLINHSCGLICVVSENGVCRYVNNSIQDITGYRSEELIGHVVMEYIHDDDIHTIRNAFLLLKTYKTVETPVFRFKAKSGEWKWLDAVITNSLDNEQIGGYIIDGRDVTLKRASQESLEKSQGFLSSFNKYHPDAVFTLTPEGIFEQVNSKICKMISYNKQEVIGEHFSKFTSHSFSFEANKAIIEAAHGKSSSLEGKIVDKNGRILTLGFVIIPIITNQRVTAILGTAKDITAEKLALKEIEKLSLIASKAVSCVIITDAAGKIEWVNSEFTRVTGYSMQEALDKKPGELLQGKETEPATVLEMHRQIKSKEPFSVEVINYRKNGEKFWFAMDISPVFDDEGRVSKFFAIQADITERKEAQKKMLFLAEDLTKQNRELQQFNYIVSHNLRAPVANILGLVSVLENVSTDEKTIRKAIDKIKQTTLSLDHVIKDLDEILSMRSHENNTHHDIISVVSVCNEVVQSLQDKIETVGATIQISVPEEVSIRANRAYVYSIFHNLLSNSLKYYREERPVKITISYQPEQETHTIIFEDNGIGIDLERFGDKIFKLYSKFDKKAEGRGLGLYMVKAQVEALGGTITLESTPGKGTTFFIAFSKKRDNMEAHPTRLP